MAQPNLSSYSPLTHSASLRATLSGIEMVVRGESYKEDY